jgi:hypothetical protein
MSSSTMSMSLLRSDEESAKATSDEPAIRGMRSSPRNARMLEDASKIDY